MLDLKEKEVTKTKANIGRFELMSPGVGRRRTTLNNRSSIKSRPDSESPNRGGPSALKGSGGEASQLSLF